jgi:MSHA biogenesis protein MshI
MNLQWLSFGSGAQGWTGVDAADGGFCTASVRTSRSSSDKPRVVQCAKTAGGNGGTDAMRDLAAKVGGVGFPCSLALHRGEYQVLVVPEPPVLESEMQASLRWTLAPMVDIPSDDANIAWMRIPTAQFQPAREKQLYAIVTRKSLVAEQAALFEKAKLPLKAVDIRETALRNIAVLLEKKNEGLGMLTVGPTGVSATFTYRGELYLDRFIAQPIDEIASGDAQRREKFFDRVTQQVYQSMELVTRTHPFITVDRIVVGPTPVPLDLAVHLAGKLPVPVQLLDLAAVFDLSAVPQLTKPDQQAQYLVALGAALRGMRKTI